VRGFRVGDGSRGQLSNASARSGGNFGFNAWNHSAINGYGMSASEGLSDGVHISLASSLYAPDLQSIDNDGNGLSVYQGSTVDAKSTDLLDDLPTHLTPIYSYPERVPPISRPCVKGELSLQGLLCPRY